MSRDLKIFCKCLPFLQRYLHSALKTIKYNTESYFTAQSQCRFQCLNLRKLKTVWYIAEFLFFSKISLELTFSSFAIEKYAKTRRQPTTHMKKWWREIQWHCLFSMFNYFCTRTTFLLETVGFFEFFSYKLSEMECTRKKDWQFSCKRLTFFKHIIFYHRILCLAKCLNFFRRMN